MLSPNCITRKGNIVKMMLVTNNTLNVLFFLPVNKEKINSKVEDFLFT